MAHRITALRGSSLDVARLWCQPVGLLFVDAVHEYAAVLADLAAWAPHVPVGGWVALHDYVLDTEHPYHEVVQAAAEALPADQWQPAPLVEYLWTARKIS